MFRHLAQVIFFLFLLIGLESLNAQQTTLSRVVDILQTNCTAASCHGSANPQANLNLTGADTVVWAALVGVDPVNPAANNKGFKLIEPGYPARSFLFRKINTIESSIQLDISEGTTMPRNAPPLSKPDQEIIRQWILHGAPKEDSVVDVALIQAYYNGLGLPEITPPSPPPAGQGFQLQFGPVFLQPAGRGRIFQKRTALFNGSHRSHRIGDQNELAITPFYLI